MKYRTATLTAACIGSLLSAQAGSAQADCSAFFEGERFTIIVPYDAGGGYDTYARAFAPVFEDVTGATMIVSNLPAAGGQVAISRVANAKPHERTLGIFGMGVASDSEEIREDSAALTPVVGVSLERSSWLALKGQDLTELLNKKLVGGGSTLVGALPEMALSALALGADLSIVTGYKGSGAVNAALLRKEIDFDTRSISSSQKAVATGDFEIVMTLSDTPVEGVDAPAFGDLVRERSADLPQDEQDKRKLYADIVTSLAANMRTVWMGKNADPTALACVIEAAEEVAAGEAFHTAAMAMKRGVTPIPHEEAQQIFDDYIAFSKASLPVLEDIRPLFE